MCTCRVFFPRKIGNSLIKKSKDPNHIKKNGLSKGSARPNPLLEETLMYYHNCFNVLPMGVPNTCSYVCMDEPVNHECLSCERPSAFTHKPRHSHNVHILVYQTNRDTNKSMWPRVSDNRCPINYMHTHYTSLCCTALWTGVTK